MDFATLFEINSPGKASPFSVARPSRWFHPVKFTGVALLVIGLVITAFLCDKSIDAFARAHANPGWRQLATNISSYVDYPYLLLVSFLVLTIAFVRGGQNLKRLGIALFLSASLAGITATTIRSVTGRTRPSATVPQGWYGLRHDSQWLIGKYQYNSFPSGHVGCAMGFAVPLFLGTRRWKALAVLLVVATGWSRIYLGCHHFSDVVVAALIGLAVGLYTWRQIIPRLFIT